MDPCLNEDFKKIVRTQDMSLITDNGGRSLRTDTL
jgi:hypothetical protein